MRKVAQIFSSNYVPSDQDILHALMSNIPDPRPTVEYEGFTYHINNVLYCGLTHHIGAINSIDPRNIYVQRSRAGLPLVDRILLFQVPLSADEVNPEDCENTNVGSIAQGAPN